jgi:sulfatase maturation enzyme AslB (radical SAM superfamily)
MKKAQILVSDTHRVLKSEDYNYVFDMRTGQFARWGKTQKDDPSWSPYGPEIMDIEISEGEGCPLSCPFCYKGNKKGDKATNMSLETFKKIFATFPKSITQIAFGITSVGSHPELFDIFQYCRDNKVIPNVTINGSDPVTDEQVKKLVKVCGAMAVSVVWPNQENGFNLIKRLTDAGATQINIHFMISKQTIKRAYEVCDSMKTDPRLAKMNAIVFLGLKPKARGQAFDVLPVEEFIKLVNYCLTNEVRFGFDSCSAPRFDKAVELSDMEEARKSVLRSCSERCESGLFSAYIDTAGKYWHCSFGENRDDAYGIDVTKVNSFLDEVWLSEPMKEWRQKLFNLDRECPLYPEIRSTTKEVND